MVISRDKQTESLSRTARYGCEKESKRGTKSLLTPAQNNAIRPIYMKSRWIMHKRKVSVDYVLTKVK